MNIYIGSDHGGFELKSQIVKYLREKYPKTNYNDNPYNINDMGCYENIRCDYPDIAQKLCNKLVNNKLVNNHSSLGILICGTGIGISIAANKIKGIRAALCTSVEHAEMSRKHNDANILALGSRMTSEKDIFNIVDVWLSTKFEAGRHLDRVNMIEYE